MPIGINSPARNLFLLGSSGAQVVTNFFKQIDQASSGNFFHTPSEIRYLESDEKFILAGEADKVSPASEKYGWIEKRQESGTQDWETQVSSTTGDNTSLQALELDGSNLVAVGKTGGVPWIAKYTDGGSITWQSTTNSGDVEYTGVAVDSNSVYYACGSTPVSGEAQAFVEKFDSSGNPGWGKSAFMLGRDVVLNKISANSRGQVVAVGYLEDDSADKGYIIKIDTATGDVLWDRTLELNIPAANIELTGVDVDNNDEIYVCGNIKYDVVGQTIPPVDGFIAKYTAEGNLLWQSQSDYASGTSSAVYYEDITIDNTTKKPTTFGYVRYAVGDSGTLISRYDPDGSLSWRREIDEGNSFDPRHTSVDGDQSFIYLLFADTADSETYVYGKVSATGNGLGDFEYNDGTGAPLLNYITSSGPNGNDIGEKIGKLSDGSVRNDTSDLMTYPFSANKLLFDDLATQVTNKRRQMDSADSFEYSGSPAVRVADFTEVDLGDESFDVNIPANEVVYESAGTYTFTVPAGVTEVSAVVVGSGGGAASSPGANAQSGGGGGGGGLAYGTFTVTPGEDLTIVVGNFGVGGASGTTAGTAGESTTISRGATVLLEGGGGAGGQADAPTGNSTIGTTASGGSSSGTERDGGGSGGSGGPSRGNFGGGGGGGAGGYNGAGGNAGSGNSEVGTGGSGGGGGGGGGQSAGGTQNNGGGGVGLFGGPINGAGGANGNPGSGGSNGQGGQPGGKGGKFGGGGGGAEDDTNAPGADGGIGGARIIWGAGRSFPNSAAQDFSSVETRVRDKSGKGNNGVVNGATLNAAGYWEFDGADDYIKVGIDPTDDYSNFTVEVWFNPASVSNYENVLDCNFNTSWVSGNVGPRLEMYATGRLTWLFSDDITNNQVNSQFDVVSGDPGDEISNGNWYHCAITFDGSGAAVYLNGEQTRTTPSSTNGSATGGEFHGFFTDVRLGNGFHLSQPPTTPERLFTGNIGEVRIYPRALTAAQVFQNYNATKSKYLNEAPDTAPKIGPGIVYDNNLLLNYDFGNRATYDRAENLFKNNSFVDRVDYNSTPNGNFTFSKGPTNSTVGPEILSPVGDLTGGTIVYDGSDASAGGISWSYRDTTLPDQNQIQFVDGDVVTYSVYAKIGSSNNTVKGIYLRTYSPETAHAFFLDSGTKAAGFNENNASPPSGASAAIEDVGNGWYRCSITLNITANDEIGFQLYLTNAAGVTGFNDAAGAGDTIHAWGAQVERNSSAGRPIKTSGTAITAPTTVKNLSSSSYNGELKGAVIIGGGFSYPTFNPDGYFDFDPADNQYIDITTLAPLADTSAVTMEAWVNVDTLTNTYQVIGTWERTTNHWQFTYSGDTNYGLSFGVAGSNDSVGITGSPATGSWQHVVATWNGGSLTTLSDWAIYVNGVAQTIQLTGATGTAGNDSYIGTRQGLAASNMLDGKMGEIRYYSRALSATEVSQNFNATRAKYGV